MNKQLRDINILLKELPGISTKQAERLSINIIENKKNVEILTEILDISKSLKKDELTGLIISKDSVANENREKDLLLILESNKDVNNVIEKTRTDKSFFILDLKNKRDFKNIENVLNRLFDVIKKYNTKEILFLLTPSLESELIMRVIKEELENSKIENKPNLTRLSMGIPFGGSIEFSDERTIKEAMSKREKA